MMSDSSHFLSTHVEALVFCSPTPIQIQEIQQCISELLDTEVPLEHIEEAINLLIEKYQSDDFAFQISYIGGGYQMLTKPKYQAIINIQLKQKSKKRLSNASLETLAVIAYKQPISKPEIEQIRGVGCDYAIQKLLEKELIEIKGKSEAVGRPLLYGTSAKLMDYLGINTLKDLPTPKDFSAEANEIGNQQ
ncbi:MAG: SMC-Scp complex subunit ScpB [Thermoflexibacter sp.]|jgi:segregation and condensation protein B|nr:SMC-Scp complex subunit ScpB [Thermoflexibacter sp.]